MTANAESEAQGKKYYRGKDLLASLEVSSESAKTDSCMSAELEAMNSKL